MLVNSSGISGACKLTFIELDLHNHSHTDSDWVSDSGFFLITWCSRVANVTRVVCDFSSRFD